MSKIDELLKNEKVEWKKLGEVCQISKGKQFNKRDMLDDGTYPVINGGILPSGYIDLFNRNENTITVSQGGASAGYVNFIEEKFWLGAHAFSVVPDNDIINEYDYEYSCFNRFLFHILKMNQINLQDSKEGAGIPSVSKDRLSIIEVPLTTKQVQQKIVKTLDKFTNYVTELHAELQARTKQYEYYRDMLLSEEYLNKISTKIDGLECKDYEVKFTTLGEIAQINRGASPRPITKYITDDIEGIPWIKIGDIGVNSKYVIKTAQKITVEGAKKSRILKKGDFIMSNSMSYGRPYILDIDGAIHDGWASISDFHNILDSDFLYYYLTSSKVQNYWKGKINSSSVSNLNSEIIRSLPIPVIDKELQQVVAKILDKFQSLLADTKGLLPQEIEQRQKQYEYYREKLLTFDENSVKRERERERAYLSNSYLNSLKEAGEIVGVSVFDVKLKRLEDIAELYDGTHQTPKYVNTGVPFVSVQDIKNIYGTNKYITAEEYNKFKIKPRKNDVFMTRIGDIGTCAIVKNDDDLAYYVTLTLIRPSNDIVLSKFLKYLIESSQGKKELSKRILHNATPIKINLGEIGKLQFLIPSIPVQEHIVSILDKFDSIVNDISKGLPKEIELRQKQYEHYREKLLSFNR